MGCPLLLPWRRSTWVVRDTRMRLPTPGTHGAPKPRLDGVPSAPDPLRRHRAGLKGVGHHPSHQRRLPWAPSTGHGRLPLHSGRRHPPRPSSTAAERSPAGWGSIPGPAQLRPPLLSPSPPGGADLGGAEDVFGQHSGRDHGRSGASGAGLLWGARQEQRLRCVSPFCSSWLPEGSAQNVWKAAWRSLRFHVWLSYAVGELTAEGYAPYFSHRVSRS
jgi:hypothetical protein